MRVYIKHSREALLRDLREASSVLAQHLFIESRDTELCTEEKDEGEQQEESMLAKRILWMVEWDKFSSNRYCTMLERRSMLHVNGRRAPGCHVCVYSRVSRNMLALAINVLYDGLVAADRKTRTAHVKTFLRMADAAHRNPLQSPTLFQEKTTMVVGMRNVMRRAHRPLSDVVEAASPYTVDSPVAMWSDDTTDTPGKWSADDPDSTMSSFTNVSPTPCSLHEDIDPLPSPPDLSPDLLRMYSPPPEVDGAAHDLVAAWHA